jgi:two-component system, response regulator RegA
MMKAPSMIIVEDDRVFRERLSRSFMERGINVVAVESVTQLKATELPVELDYAVIDLRVGTESGVDALAYLREFRPQCKAVMLTGFGTIATSVEAMKLGAVNYLTKPTTAAAILAALSEEVAAESVLEADIENQELPTLAQAEWEHIQRVLQSCEGNITQAAALLGLHRRSLQRKLAKDPDGLR